MTKVAFNVCHGGFGLSYKATMRYAELKGTKLYAFVRERDASGNRIYDQYVPATEENAKDEFMVHYYTSEIRYEDNYYYLGHMEEDRTDPDLIKVIEELGDEANGECACLRIAEITAGTLYRIDEYDGFESVMTQADYRWNLAR